MPWDPDRYNQFKRERAAPFDDLLGLVERRPGLKVIDLGCGTGELTRRLADALPGSQALGIDSSPEMLEKSAAFARPGLRFEPGDLRAVTGAWDLVFSNAAIQWVEDHAWLLPRLFSLLRPAGQLAVQLPSNYDHPTHTLIREIACQAPFRAVLGSWQRDPQALSIDAYARLLYNQGAQRMVVFEKVYPHVLPDAAALADWTSGTALVPYFERLGPALSETFLDIYRRRLAEIFPERPVFYGFKRILFSAFRSA
ncbi:MAG: methyltransferase domain-containing protein [Chloroflexota bacterium]